MYVEYVHWGFVVSAAQEVVTRVRSVGRRLHSIYHCHLSSLLACAVDYRKPLRWQVKHHISPATWAGPCYRVVHYSSWHEQEYTYLVSKCSHEKSVRLTGLDFVTSVDSNPVWRYQPSHLLG